ncbi:MAG: TetR/AcrR family transcriptional regulator [Henriciella sp.]|uniref:TetR/AcrR family transcriptional regulator n=1 Tax=Henriciella sp. TaxID=1968823 RepID=UPI0032EE264D
MAQALNRDVPSPARKRSAKRDAILDEGALVMNRDGAGSVRVGDIAEVLGLSRNALYYYVKDRSDLVRQCYERSCDTIEASLDHAASLSGDAAQKVTEFVKHSLVPDHAQRAALADIAILNKADCDAIRHRQARHVASLSSLFDSGQAAGTFRAFDSLTAAHALLGMIDWVLHWASWTARRQQPANTLNDYANAVVDCLLNGFVLSDASQFECAANYVSISQKHFNVFDRQDANLLRRQQLVEAASRVFNVAGLDGGSIEMIADAVGATKGAVYHHFESKADLVEGCYEHAFFVYELVAQVAHEQAATPAEALLIDFHLNCQAQASLAPPLILQPGIMRLPDRYLKRSTALADQMLATFLEGQKRRHIRDASPLTVEVAPGAFFWIQKWHDSLPQHNGQLLADELTSIIGSGILST